MTAILFQKSKRPKKLVLGEDYIVSWFGKNPKEVRLIQPTEKGYNFLDMKTNKCILKHHLYPSKKLQENNYYAKDPKDLWFWITEYLNIDKVKEKIC